jgi:hypothetical protein
MDQQPGTAIVEGGIRAVNFFNGRLLSGEDLSREQEANRLARQRLGRATGPGVAYGLDVARASDLAVTVEAGLAVAGSGQPLLLSGRVSLALGEQPGATAPTPAAGFRNCAPFAGGVYIARQGLYLLTIAPAEVGEGRAPVSGLGNSAAPCNTRYLVEGVQFRLLPVDMARDLGLSSEHLGDEAHLRSRLAAICLGLAARRKLLADPFGGRQPADALDALRPLRLTDCDVPLALIYRTEAGGLVFVDNWSVRRPIMAPEGVPGALTGDSASPSGYLGRPALIGAGWALRTAAMMMQFDEQISQIAESDRPVVAASSRLLFLPPAGIIPAVRSPGAGRGFTVATFFGGAAAAGQAYDEIDPIDAGQVRGLLREALDHEPIELAGPGQVQLYRIWENVQATAAGAASQAAVVFASRSLPYRGAPRFGSARVGRSRFGPQLF